MKKIKLNDWLWIKKSQMDIKSFSHETKLCNFLISIVYTKFHSSFNLGWTWGRKSSLLLAMNPSETWLKKCFSCPQWKKEKSNLWCFIRGKKKLHEDSINKMQVHKNKSLLKNLKGRCFSSFNTFKIYLYSVNTCRREKQWTRKTMHA